MGPAGEHTVFGLADVPQDGRAGHTSPDAEGAAGSGAVVAVAGAADAAEQEGNVDPVPPHALPLGAAGAGPE